MYVTACGIRNQEYMLEAFEKGEKNAIPFTLFFYSFTLLPAFQLENLEAYMGKHLHLHKRF